MLSWSLDSDKLLDDQSNIIRRPRPLSFVLLFALITSNCWAPLWVNDVRKRSSGSFLWDHREGHREEEAAHRGRAGLLGEPILAPNVRPGLTWSRSCRSRPPPL